MKKIKWVVAAAFGFMTMTAYAQTAPAQDGEKTEQHQKHHKHKGHAGMGKEDVKAYEAELKLSPEQVSQWQALNETSRAAMKNLRDNTALAREDKKAQMKTLREQKQAWLQKILTQEQFARYQQIRKEKMKERRTHKLHKGDRKSGK